MSAAVIELVVLNALAVLLDVAALLGRVALEDKLSEVFLRVAVVGQRHALDIGSFRPLEERLVEEVVTFVLVKLQRSVGMLFD